MKIQEKKLTDITPYENNPRNNDEAVQYVANSIKEFGFKQPIVIDLDGTIIAGHTRYKAAKKLGLETVPCVVASDLTPEQVNAYRLADNKVSEFATWDMDLLNEELDGLLNIDMEEFGFFDFQVSEEIEIDTSEKQINDQVCVAIDCETEEKAERVFNELSEMGYECRILTL